MKIRLVVTALLCGMLSLPVNAKDVCLQGSNTEDTIRLKLSGLHFKKGRTGNFTGYTTIQSGALATTIGSLITGVYYTEPDGKSVSYWWLASGGQTGVGQIDGAGGFQLPLVVGSSGGSGVYSNEHGLLPAAYEFSVINCKTYTTF